MKSLSFYVFLICTFCQSGSLFGLSCVTHPPKLTQSQFEPKTQAVQLFRDEIGFINFTMTVRYAISKNFSENVPHVIATTEELAFLVNQTLWQQEVVLPANQSEASEGCSVDVQFTGQFAVKSNLLGAAVFHVVAEEAVLDKYIVFVLNKTNLVDTIFRVFISIFVIGMTFTMGCELDYQIIVNYLRRPIAPCIGFLSQYLIMPLTAFTLTQILPIDQYAGFGLFIIGCCPGGGGSNMWTLLFKGDLNLSMTMTFLSSVAAFGMMPLWLFLLGGYFVDKSLISIPYLHIAGSLAMVVIPVFFGMLTRWYRPMLADKVSRFTRWIALGFIFFMLTLGTYVNWEIYRIIFSRHYSFLLLAGGPLPFLGFLLGGILALLLRQNRQQVIAISLETGIQNIGIAMVILLSSMPQPYGSIGIVTPLAVALFTPLPLVVVLAGMKIKACLTRRQQALKSDNDEPPIIEEEKKYMPLGQLDPEQQDERIN